jgi:hypothetical protein
MAVRVALALPFLWFAAACASTAPSAGSPPVSPPGVPAGVRISDFAAAEGLRTAWEPVRRRWLLSAGEDRVLLFAGMPAAVVNGARLTGLDGALGAGDGGAISGADAERIRAALKASRRPAPRPSDAVSAVAATAPTGPTVDPGPPAPFPGLAVVLARKWKYIVIHHSGTRDGSAATFDRFHRTGRGWDGLGYHFVIGNGLGAKDGGVEVGYRWTKQLHGAHAGRPADGSNVMNETGIGICLVGDFTRQGPSAAQKETLHRLIDWLVPYCGLRPENVLLHRDIRATECPGRCFPAAEFR